MAVSLKVIRAVFADLHRTSLDADLMFARIRNALVHFDSHGGNRYAFERCLEACNSALGGYGVECIRDDDGSAIAEYVNMGDTYIATVLYSYRTQLMYVTSWGDWYERSPECREHDRRERAREREQDRCAS